MADVRLLDNEALVLGVDIRAALKKNVADANAHIWMMDLPVGGAVGVPVLAVGVRLDNIDLGMFDGLTQPMVATIDVDKDSYVGFHYSADDTPVIRMRAGGGGTVRNHILPDVASDTFVMLAATQTLTNKTLTTPTITTSVVLTRTALGASPDIGFHATNTTAAAAGAQQVSPAIRWTGQGWKTDATAASQAVEFQAYVLPVQGAAAPTGGWHLQAAINGAAYATRFSVFSDGNVGVSTTTFGGGATFNLTLGGGATTPVLGGATADIVALAAVDIAGGDRRLAVQSETGSAIYVGADRLRFAAATAYLGIGATDVVTLTATTLTLGSSVLTLNNPAGSFAYTIVSSAIAANRNLTIPLLTAADTLAVLGLAQTFTAVQTFNVTVDFSGTGFGKFRSLLAGNKTFSWQHDAIGFYFQNDTDSQALLRVPNAGGLTIFALGVAKYTFAAALLTFADAVDIAVNGTTGTKIGTATTQKLGVYNATPVVQGAAVADAAGGANIDAEARTALNALLARIRSFGIIAA